jgi:presenilin 1
MSAPDRYGAIEAQSPLPTSTGTYALQQEQEEHDGLMRTTTGSRSTQGSQEAAGEFDDDTPEFSIQELLYSSSSYYAIAKPVTLTMVLAALSVCFINNDETRADGAEAMAQAYQTFSLDNGNALALSLANALIMVSAVCLMTFGIVLLYRYKFMKCLIGYMMLASMSLLGLMGSNLVLTAIAIFQIPIDKVTFGLFMLNFAAVGVIAVFFGLGVPKYITQAYLVATAVILAWHLSYFDAWTTWTLLLMLALYDLCAVLTPCGPLKALVNLMSEDDAPEMPGLLFEAELPPEAKRPKSSSHAQTTRSNNNNSDQQQRQKRDIITPPQPIDQRLPADEKPESRHATIPLAIAKVYQLPVISIPVDSMATLYPNSDSKEVPLLANDTVSLPDHPTVKQLQSEVVVRLPPNGGRLERVARRGKRMYMERDRHGNPKRVLWVDRRGKVFAEMSSGSVSSSSSSNDDDDDDGNHRQRNTIRLGLGDFIFYSVLVAKAAQYSFMTFAACMLVILAGLGGTLILLSVYGHALPALPISIFMGVVCYGTTRLFVEPWVEAVMSNPYAM